MKKVTVSARPKYPRNHLVFRAVCQPVLRVEQGVCKGLLFPTDDWNVGTLRQHTTVLPGTARELALDAFRGLKTLEHVCFDKRPVELSAGAFAGCTGLKSVQLGKGIVSIPLEAFAGCRSLRHLVLPDTLGRINMDAFKNCEALESVRLPASLELIESFAFWGCRSLEEIRLPEGLRELGENVFGSCTALRRAYLPDSLESIGDFTFQNCTNLEEVILPKELRQIPMGTFAGCRSLRRIVLPEKVEYISPYAFWNCTALETVEHPQVEKFAQALAGTPAGKKLSPVPGIRRVLPLELVNQVSGAVSGFMLSAMGYAWFDIDKQYRFLPTKKLEIIEVQSRYPDKTVPGGFGNDLLLMSPDLEPIPEAGAVYRVPDEDLSGERKKLLESITR
ncbi:MAG: leucine-rich repeat domain-containing protein [Oscillospiraceae bacterium]|nr:leucine-rich repeat domain-containing protein [Oscillospiraceae bacterium]